MQQVSKKLEKLKIGYAPFSKDMTGPGDRRRFVFWAKESGLFFENADPSQRYDLVYITSSANISDWISYKAKHPNVKLIFELTDSYLLADAFLYGYVRGITRYVTGKDSRWVPDYRNAFRQIIRVADAVVCSTPIQRDNMLPLNGNVHVSLDYFSDEILVKKTNYQVGPGKVRLVWEGQAVTVENLYSIRTALRELKDEVVVHVISDPFIKYPVPLLRRSTSKFLAGLPCKVIFDAWEKSTFSSLLSRDDLAVIPINQRNSLMWNKPENKLLLLWELGIPVITSATPAYKRVMDMAGIHAYCDSESVWVEKLRHFGVGNVDVRQEYMKKASTYLEDFHTKQILLSNWNRIFESVL
jgi:hypothetical protein